MGIIFLYASFFFSLLYFLFSKRRVDFLVLYFFSLFLFSLPAFFSMTYIVGKGGYSIPSLEMYFVYGVAFLGCALVAIVSDYNEMGAGNKRCVQLSHENSLPVGFFCLSSLMFSLLILYSVYAGLAGARNKSEALEGVGIEYMILGGLSVVGFLVSHYSGKRFFQVAFFLVVFFLFLVGSRSPLVFLILGWFVIRFQDKELVLLKKYKWFFLGLIALTVVILGKSLYGYLYSGKGFGAWFSDIGIEYFLSGSEFLRTNGVLSLVLDSKYEIPGWSVPASLLKVLPFPEGVYSFDISYFANNFQGDNLAWVDYGVAFNPWAEAYSWMGLAGVVIYALLIPCLLRLLWRLMHETGNPVYKTLFIVCGVTIAFWIHRNTLGSTLGYIRNVFYPVLIIYLFSKGAAVFFRRLK